MKSRLLLAGVALVALTSVTAMAQQRRSLDRSHSTEDEVHARASALVAQMTPEEKAGQLTTLFYIPRPGAVELYDKGVADGSVGNLLFASDAATTNRLQRIAVTQSRLKIPLLFGYDVVHGLRTMMPVPIGLAASWDVALAEQAQAVAAAESRAVGIHWVFAPMVDIARDPRWGRIVEGAGEDPYLGSAMAAAQVRGFQGPRLGAPSHVIAGPKHFLGYGAAVGGRDYEQSDVSDEQLWNVYMPPFKAAIEAGAGNVMSAYMALNGVPASGNRWLLTDVLRGALRFKGFVVGDANAVASTVRQGLAADKVDAAGRAINAGLDMEMAFPGSSAYVSSLPKLLAERRVSQQTVDDAVRRVIAAKIRMGLFEQPYVDEDAVGARLDDPAHREVARVAAERSAVLLRNEGALLPLDLTRIRSVALIGPFADDEREMLGPWTFPANRPRGVSVLAGLRGKLGSRVRIDHTIGVGKPQRLRPSMFAAMEPKPASAAVDDATEIARAVALARGADVAILALGESQDMDGEGASRSSLDLPGRQQELLEAVLATGKPVVVLLFSGRPLDLKGAKPAAILDMWYPGSEGGTAAANLLTGAATPAGRLPFSWLTSAAHAPNTYDRLLTQDDENNDKRYWNDASSKPSYPFGFGLSYTSFSYSNLVIDGPSPRIGESVQVHVDVRNTGQRPGDEVAQLYIHQRFGTSARPGRQLKGFTRVSLRPGETRRLSFTLSPDDLRYWSAATRGWVADAAPFDVWVGGSSEASLAGSFNTAADASP